VKVHRSRLMHKMKARSLPELSRMADKLKLVPESRNTPEPDVSFFLRLARETARCAVLMVRRLIYNVLHPLDPLLRPLRQAKRKGRFRCGL
jgi:Response regulator